MGGLVQRTHDPRNFVRGLIGQGHIVMASQKLIPPNTPRHTPTPVRQVTATDRKNIRTVQISLKKTKLFRSLLKNCTLLCSGRGSLLKVYAESHEGLFLNLVENIGRLVFLTADYIFGQEQRDR